MKLKLFLSLVLVAATFGLRAQDITTSTLRWSATIAQDVDAGTNTAVNAGVISYPDRIDWLGNNGEVQRSFTITKTMGFWPNVSLIGEITFAIDQNGKTGTIQFSKDGSGIYVRLNLSTPTNPDITELKISSVKTQ